MIDDETPMESTASLDSVNAPLHGDENAPHRLSAQDQAAVEALGPDTALLIVHHGPNQGARFLLDVDITTAGRSVSADIFLDDVTVSREHATFVREGTTFSVKDAGSLNGTYVNRQLTSEAVLHEGDEVQVGKYRMTFYPGHSS